jgi:hypothetical protein
MSPSEAQVEARAERRRSERWPLALPLVVRGVSLHARSFQEETFTLSISAHGALLAMSTTVTLGQTLFLRNPHTQDEAGAWVTRLGPPRAGFAQVGIEFVRPDADFWSNRLQPPAKEAEPRSGEGIHVLPPAGGDAASEAASSETGEPASRPPAPSPDESDSPATLASASSGILLSALELTLQQAAEQAVAAAATAHLGAAVNQAAVAIDNFSKARVRQLEERLVQYREELAAWARQDFVTQIQAEVARGEERLRKRADEFIEEAARNAQGEFTERLRQTANGMAAKFVEDWGGFSAQHVGDFAAEIQAATSEARTRIEATSAGLHESHEKARGEMERAVAETQQRMESLASQTKEANADGEARLRAFQEELARAKEQEVDHFRERLRNVLTTLLGSLG